MRFLKTAILTSSLFAASLGLAYVGYPWLEPARLLYDVHGIDVSHHQGAIDWQAVAGDGVAFAYIKATEGGDFTDRRFAENWAAAVAAGSPRRARSSSPGRASNPRLAQAGQCSRPTSALPTPGGRVRTRRQCLRPATSRET